MREEEILEVNETALESARNKWRRKERCRSKFSLNFDELVHCFKTGMRLEDIAKRSGTVRQNISNLYSTYFKDVFGGTGRQRQHQISLSRRRMVAGRHFESKERKELRGIARLAGRQGYLVETVHCINNHEPSGRVNGHLLLVNNKICRVHYLSNTQQTNPRSLQVYTHATVSRKILSTSDFSIFVCRPLQGKRRIFIVPNRVLLKHLFQKNSRVCQFYLPTNKKRKKNGRRPKINFWDYADAWRLLQK